MSFLDMVGKNKGVPFFSDSSEADAREDLTSQVSEAKAEKELSRLIHVKLDLCVFGLILSLIWMKSLKRLLIHK